MRPKLPIARLLKAQRRWEKTLRTLTATSRKFITKPRKSKPKKSKLTEIGSFGSNPCNLRMLTYVPPLLTARAPLVVVLHGCLQTARDYDEGSGWSLLAKRQGFALIYAEQTRANNPNRCFNWFQSHNARRGSGEALSIRQMITCMRRSHSIDPESDLHHGALGRRRHGLGDAGHLSRGLCRGRDHRRSALRCRVLSAPGRDGHEEAAGAHRSAMG